jgi:hypothetical protein
LLFPQRLWPVIFQQLLSNKNMKKISYLKEENELKSVKQFHIMHILLKVML